MSKENIWEGIDFKNLDSSISAYDYLIDQSVFLENATDNELKMNVERVEAYLDEVPISLVLLTKLFVVAPKLGNFRIKILTVTENKYEGVRFPVDIYCHIDEKKESKVPEETFIDKINEILNRPIVKLTVENLYKQSKGLPG